MMDRGIVRARVESVTHVIRRKPGPVDLILEYTEYGLETTDEQELNFTIKAQGSPKFAYGEVMDIWLCEYPEFKAK